MVHARLHWSGRAVPARRRRWRAQLLCAVLACTVLLVPISDGSVVGAVDPGRGRQARAGSGVGVEEREDENTAPGGPPEGSYANDTNATDRPGLAHMVRGTFSDEGPLSGCALEELAAGAMLGALTGIFAGAGSGCALGAQGGGMVGAARGALTGATLGSVGGAAVGAAAAVQRPDNPMAVFGAAGVGAACGVGAVLWTGGGDLGPSNAELPRVPPLSGAGEAARQPPPRLPQPPPQYAPPDTAAGEWPQSDSAAGDNIALQGGVGALVTGRLPTPPAFPQVSQELVAAATVNATMTAARAAAAAATAASAAAEALVAGFGSIGAEEAAAAGAKLVPEDGKYSKFWQVFEAVRAGSAAELERGSAEVVARAADHVGRIFGRLQQLETISENIMQESNADIVRGAARNATRNLTGSEGELANGAGGNRPGAPGSSPGAGTTTTPPPDVDEDKAASAEDPAAYGGLEDAAASAGRQAAEWLWRRQP